MNIKVRNRILVLVPMLILAMLVTFIAPVKAVDRGISPNSNCSSMIVGKNVSTTGNVILAHNEDNGDNVMVQYKVPRLSHEPGELITLEEGRAKIPQVPQTWSYMWSETRASWKASFSDFFINENGVAVASDSCAPSKEDRTDEELNLKDGGIGYGIRRIIAERAASARDGVEIAISLINEYGYFASGRSYQIADKDEAWVLQIVRGRHYVARRVGDDEVLYIPNWYTIHNVDFNDSKNFIASPDLVDYAIERGWYDPAKDGAFDFAKAYQHEDANAGFNILRAKNAWRILLGSEPAEQKPFSIKPDRKIGIEDLKKVLRCHFEGTQDDLSYGYQTDPHYTPNFTICNDGTMESSITEFRDNPDFTVVWRTTGRPCTSPYVPWYLGSTRVPDGYGWIDYKTGIATHFNPSQDDLTYNPDRAWWAFMRVQEAARPQYGAVIGEIQKYRDSLENQFEARQDGIEQAAYAMYKKSPEKAREYLTQYTNKAAGQAWDLAEKLYDKITK